MSSRCRRFEGYSATGPQNSSLSFTTYNHCFIFSHPLAKLLKFYLFKGSKVCPSLHLGDGANGRLKSLSCYEKLFHSILRPFPSQLKNKQFYQILIRSGTQELTCKTSSWEPQGLPRTKQLMFHIFGLFKLFMCYLWISFPPRITNNATNVEWETHQPFSRQIVKVKNALESKKQSKLVTTSYFIFNYIEWRQLFTYQLEARQQQGRPRDHHFPPFITLAPLAAVYRCQSEEASFYSFLRKQPTENVSILNFVSSAYRSVN